MTSKEYYISRKEIRRLHKAAYAAQQDGHFEVCGLLIVDENRDIELYFLDDTLNKSYSYEVNLRDIVVARRKIRLMQKMILGSFHSHPVGYAIPSVGDLNRGFYKRIELIYDVCAMEPRLWTYKTKASIKKAIELTLTIRK